MAAVTPKTIVITALPRKTTGMHAHHQLSDLRTHQTTTTTARQMTTVLGSPELTADGQPRKRRRLTHLSPEERMLRRKLKNRVAAQTARDRKKAKMTELEEVVAELEAENKRLAEENSRLKEQSGILVSENHTLRDRLGQQTMVKKELTPCESAVLNVPLPQEQVFALSQLMVHCRAILLMLSLTYCLGYSKKSVPATKLPSVAEEYLHPEPTSPSQHTVPHKWWGRHQKNWNPSMN